MLSRITGGRPLGFGAYLFVLHRLTGVVLTFYLFVHLVTLGAVLEGPEGFDRAMEAMSRPEVRLLELLLVAAVLFHALNGLRLTLLSLGSRFQSKKLGFAVLALTLAAVMLSLPYFFSFSR